MRFLIENRGGYLYSGFYRTTIDSRVANTLPTKGRLKDGRRYFLGDSISPTARTLDIELKIESGSVVAFDTDEWAQNEWNDDPMPADPISFFGIPQVDGVPLSLVSIGRNGACIESKFAARTAPMIVSTLHLRYVPGETHAFGVLTTTCSNSSLPDLSAKIPDMRLKMGRQVYSEGYADRGMSDWIGDGQQLHQTVAVAFTDDSQTTSNCLLHRGYSVVGHALKTIGYAGIANQARFDPRQFATETFGGELTAREGWDVTNRLGITKNSTVTGDQETQGFQQGHESFYPGGTSAYVPRLLVAYGYGRQPCHHLDANSIRVKPETHPNLVMWSGRPHWHTGVSPDQLGKPRAINLDDTHGWFGPDRQHVFIHDLAASYEITGCPALQDELENAAWNYLLEDTVDPRLSTSGSDEPRSAGWRGMMVAHLWRLLKNRELATRVRDRWLARVEQVYALAWGNRIAWSSYENFGGDINNIAAYPRKAFWYQQAVAVYGIYVASTLFSHQQGIDLAVAGAEAVFKYGYEDGMEWPVTGIRADGLPAEKPYRDLDNASRGWGWFRYKWMPLALYVVVKGSHDPAVAGHAKQYYDMLLNEYRGVISNQPEPADWFAPL